MDTRKKTNIHTRRQSRRTSKSWPGTIRVEYKGKTRNIPKRYLANLKGDELRAQKASIFSGEDRPRTSFKSRKSGWTQKFNKEYGDMVDKLPGGRTLENISKVTGIDVRALRGVYKKGAAAYYNGGSRPNQTKDSWAYARCYSYIMGGPTRAVDDELTRKYNVKFKNKNH